jgi:CDP-4-dehydro-6-deoxyglucose reductase, E3
VARIEYGGEQIELGVGETVLDGLLRAGIAAAHSCRAGHCRACAVRAPDGDAPAAAQVGLKDAWRARGIFLACQARPERDLRVASLDELGLEVGVTTTAV